jgi:hypothetical protein
MLYEKFKVNLYTFKAGTRKISLLRQYLLFFIPKISL